MNKYPNLPRFSIFWDRSGFDLTLDDKIFSTQCKKGQGIVVGQNNFSEQLCYVQDKNSIVVVIGSPIFSNNINLLAVAKELLLLKESKNKRAIEHFSRELNGQFLLIKLDKKEKCLTIVNDRFNGIPIYYANVKEGFFASFLYFDLFTQLSAISNIKINKSAFFEFIWLQKLQSDKTYDNKSKFLLPASILEIKANDKFGQESAEYYWQPSFTKNSYSSVAEAGEEFISCLKESIKLQTSDIENKRYGLFLSGGHDSRTVLSAFDIAPECFTVAFSKNYEVSCAAKAAKCVGAAHHFLKLLETQLDDYQDEMAVLCGGMYATDNALFMGLGNRVKQYADIVFHGHGFDYLFQGMYIPTQTIQLFGRPTFFRKLMDLQGDIAELFINNISFRIKNNDFLALIKKQQRDEMYQYLLDSTKKIVLEGEKMCRDHYDLWEYLIIHALGRHYSYPNISSKMTACQQRTVSFENNLFNFYLSLPIKYRISADVLRYALNHIKPELGKIPTGNYGIAAGASPLFKTSWLIGRKLLRHLTFNGKLHAPHATDRTWPDQDRYLAKYKQRQEFAKMAINSEILHEYMPYFDWDKIKSLYPAWCDGSIKGGGKFLNSLISLDRFLQQV